MARVREVINHWEALPMAIEEGVNVAIGSDQFPCEPNDGTIASVRETEYYAEAGIHTNFAYSVTVLQPAVAYPEQGTR